MKGKLVVLYGINNLGKTTQARLLVDKLIAAGHQAEYLKYALYELEPSGPLINDYLRNSNPQNLTAREFQIIQVLNRTQYDSRLRQKLDSGTWVVAEDYVGTGIAWGMGADVSKDFLVKLNRHLLKEDLAFYFKGSRFREAEETDHLHETDQELLSKVDACHQQLANDYNWLEINANDTIENISQFIWKEVTNFL